MEAMMMPYKYAYKGVKAVGKTAYKVAKPIVSMVGSFLGKVIGVGYRSGDVSKIGKVYSTFFGKTGKLLKGTVDIGSKVIGGVGKGIGAILGVGFKGSDISNIKEPYEATIVATMEASRQTVAGMSVVGNAIISTIANVFNIERQRALNRELAEEIATKNDEKIDENRKEGKIRKGSYITRLKELSNKGLNSIKRHLPTKEVVKKASSNTTILALLIGLGSMVSKIVAGISSIPKLLGNLGSSIVSSIFKLPKLLGGVIGSIASKGTSALAKLGKVAKYGKGIVEKVGIKGLGKSILKKIPGLGLIAGLGFGVKRLWDGDYKGALAEVGSGALSLVPGVGTMGSLAVDGWLAKRDYEKDSNKNIVESTLKPVNNNITEPPIHTVDVKDNDTTKPVVNIPKTTGTGKERIMSYLAEAEGEVVHKNRHESDITLPYGIYRKNWKNTKVEKYLKSIAPQGNLVLHRKEVNATIKSNPEVHENVKNLAYEFYEKHFLDKRINSILNSAEQLIFFSNSVNGGKSRGIKALQSAVGAPITGRVDSKLFTYIKKARDRGVDIARGMLHYMKNYYAMLIRKNPAKYKINERGWNNRLIRLEKEIGKTPTIPNKSTHIVANNSKWKPTKTITPVAHKNPVVTPVNRVDIKSTPITHVSSKLPQLSIDKKSTTIETPTATSKIDTPKPTPVTTKVDNSESKVSQRDIEELNTINDTLNKQLDIQVKIYQLLKEMRADKHKVKDEAITPTKPTVNREIKNSELPTPVVGLERKRYGT